jgi:hypothetical protein
MKNLFLLILFFPVFYPAYSQAPATGDYENAQRNGLMGFEYRNSAVRYNNNQYFSDWAKGDVNLENGDVISNIFIRYDQLLDEVLWLRETDFKTGVLPRGDIRGFVLYNERMEPTAEFMRRKIKLSYKSDSTETFLQVLVKGNIELFAYRKVMQSASDYTLRDDTRWLIFSNGNSYYVGPSKRLLLKVPGIDEVKMKSVLKTNRIRLDGTEISLRRAVDMYNRSNE